MEFFFFRIDFNLIILLSTCLLSVRFHEKKMKNIMAMRKIKSTVKFN